MYHILHMLYIYLYSCTKYVCIYTVIPYMYVYILTCVIYTYIYARAGFHDLPLVFPMIFVSILRGSGHIQPRKGNHKCKALLQEPPKECSGNSLTSVVGL